jgi:predicted ester cyclase
MQFIYKLLELFMNPFQSAKHIVRNFHDTLDQVTQGAAHKAIEHYCSDDLIWRGYYPFDELQNGTEVASKFWDPLKNSLRSMQRREDVFFAGRNFMADDEAIWVVSMGHMMGLFDNPWIGIAPTGKMVALRYCEFNCVIDGKIVQSAMYFDIPHLMAQAGQNPFPNATAQQLVQPGPMTHDGILIEDQPIEEGEKTLALINKMCSELGQWQSDLPLEDELRQSWHEDMIWWGPTGIGSTYTIERYAKQHSGPFRAAFSDRSKTNHIARLAEGNYGGFFGWPNFTARLTGDFMGFAPTGKNAEFRVIDIYRRDGDKLSENWIFIDLLHFWKQQGIEILNI